MQSEDVPARHRGVLLPGSLSVLCLLGLGLFEFLCCTRLVAGSKQPMGRMASFAPMDSREQQLGHSVNEAPCSRRSARHILMVARIMHEVARHRFRGAVVARGLAEPCDTNNIIIAASHFIGGKGEVGEEMVRPRPLY